MSRTSPMVTERTLLRLGGGLIAGMVLLGGCTSGGDDGANPDPDSGAPSDSADIAAAGEDLPFASPGAEDFNRVVASRDDLTATMPVAVLSVDSLDALSLSVTFEMESHHCHGITASVEETVAEIIIEVRTALLPERSLADCSYGIFPYTTVLPLDAPVGGRTIVLAEDREPEPLAAAEATSLPPAQDETETGPEDAGPDDAGPEDTGPDDAELDDTDQEVGQPLDAAAAAADPDFDRFIGRHIEEGVEWAINNEIRWRLISQDGVAVDPDGAIEPGTVGFVVAADLIVSYEIS